MSKMPDPPILGDNVPERGPSSDVREPEPVTLTEGRGKIFEGEPAG